MSFGSNLAVAEVLVRRPLVLAPLPSSLLTLFSADAFSINSDLREYLERYPHAVEDPDRSGNRDFYQNRLRSRPHPCATIDEIHSQWKGDFDLLEAHHGYIQFLFPIRESGGVNIHAQPLMKHEIAALVENDPAFPARLLRSYELMLEFYGIELADRLTGALRRTPGYLARYQHLNYSTHNYLRITRILKSLGELGMERLKLPFLLHILGELASGALRCATVGRSFRDYWVGLLRDPREVLLVQRTVCELKQMEQHTGPCTLSDTSIGQILRERTDE